MAKEYEFVGTYRFWLALVQVTLPVRRGHGEIIVYPGDRRTGIIKLIVHALLWVCDDGDEDEELGARPAEQEQEASASTCSTEQDQELSRILEMLQQGCYNQGTSTSSTMKDEVCRPMLGVTEDASLEEATKKFRRLSLLIHPDKCPDARAPQAFIALKDAFDRLKVMLTAPDEPRWAAVFDSAQHSWQDQHTFFRRRPQAQEENVSGDEGSSSPTEERTPADEGGGDNEPNFDAFVETFSTTTFGWSDFYPGLQAFTSGASCLS